MKWFTWSSEGRAAESSFRIPHVTLTVGPSENNAGKQWQWFSMSLGVHSKESHDACLQTWPQLAIDLARAELDVLESTIGERP